MQAEACSHAGTNTTWWCRRCKSGGTKKHRITNEGYLALTTVQEARNVPDTVHCILSQLATAMAGESRHRAKQLIISTGVKDTLTLPVIENIFLIWDQQREAESKNQTQGRSARTRDELQVELQEIIKRYGKNLLNPLLRSPGKC
jgi:hypothetical protein